MRPVRIGDRPVGPGHPAYIIAEVGANHDRDLDVAHRMIDVAAECSADAVKFQTYSADGLYSRYAPRLTEMDDFDRAAAEETPHAMIQRLELPRSWQPELRDHAVERGLDFLSTPFDLDAVHDLAELGVKAFKTASYEITYIQMLQEAARYGRPMIVSTGNSSAEDVHDALNAIRHAGDPPVILLHCVSQYPARHEDLHLRAMAGMAARYGVPVGFSDHTMDAVAATVAVGLGACCFEKHFTLDRRRKGPDHPSALEPDELAEYVRAIRLAETILGSPDKCVQPSEEENHRLARRSVHAATDLREGDVITESMLAIKRPALGIDPRETDRVVGRRAARAIKADEWITWDMLQ